MARPGPTAASMLARVGDAGRAPAAMAGCPSGRGPFRLASLFQEVGPSLRRRFQPEFLSLPGADLLSPSSPALLERADDHPISQAHPRPDDAVVLLARDLVVQDLAVGEEVAEGQ